MGVYSTFEAGHKYSCVSGGSLPEQKDYGIGTGICSPTGGSAKSPYKTKFTVIPKFRYQSQHPCAVVCEPNGPNQCVPGPNQKIVDASFSFEIDGMKMSMSCTDGGKG